MHGCILLQNFSRYFLEELPQRLDIRRNGGTVTLRELQ